MKHAVMLAVVATLALGGAPAGASAPAEGTEAAADAQVGASAAFTVGQPPSKAFMVGTWGEGEACDQPLNFQADGTIKDGPLGKWTLEAGQLVLDGTYKLKLTVVDENAMKSLAEGSTETHTLKRCA